MEAEDIEKCETVVRETVRYERTGMSLGMKSDIGVCVTMILLTILSVFITAFKILLIDMNSEKYAHLFGRLNDHNTSTTIGPTNLSQ